MWGVHGRLEPLDTDSCRLHLGADSPRMLAYLLTVLDVDFTVEAPAGYAEYLASVAARFERAAASSATVSGGRPRP